MSRLLSRVAALGLLLGAVALVLLGAVLPLVERHRDAEAEIALLEAQYARFAASLAEAPAATGIEIAEPALLEGASPAVAAAALQERIEAAAARAGVELESLRVEPPAAAGPALQIPVSAEIAASLPGAQALLHAIATARPYLRVTRLDMRRDRARAREDGRVAVRLSLRVEGTMRAPAAE